MVNYQWTADGELEACFMESFEVDNPVECYHCGMLIPRGYATKLTALSDGSVYVLHTRCAKQSCYSK